ncbi:MFS transporter [Actinomadura sediminis]|uniref:MFS transporter n=1 Tax=Actinomadura sediminis TaxID=1038904 RepID=A0ABW3EN94_9ACTN
MSANPKAGPKEWLGLAVLALPTLLLSLDITVLHLGVPHISAALDPSGTELLWIIDVYGFMIAGFLVTMGNLGDRIGRRRLLTAGAAAFGAASALAAYAPGPELLIAARTVMGIAGATLMPSTLSLISSMFRDPRERGMAIGVWATMFSAGVALGPVLGGVLLDNFWWGSVFLLGVPIMVLLLAAAPVLLPEFRDPGGGPLDLPSVALSLTAMLPITYGIKELPAHGFSAAPAAAILVGIAAGVLFVRRQRILEHPLLDLRLFAAPAFRGALVVLLVSTGAVGGIYLFITQYLQLVAGQSPLRAGLWLLPAAGALVVSSLTAPLIARRVGAGRTVAASLAVSTLGYLLLAQVDDGIGLLVTGFVLVYLGVGPTMALGTDLVVGAAPPEKAGAASAVSETSTELGVALGVAVLGSIGTAIYRRATDGEHETLAEAVTAAGELPGRAAATVLGDATAAFTGGLNVTAWIGAALMAGLVVLAATTLRSPAQPETEEAPSKEGEAMPA